MRFPKPSYPCCECCEDYSWPASDLRWCEATEDWYCDNCADEVLTDEQFKTLGPRLSEALPQTYTLDQIEAWGRKADQITGIAELTAASTDGEPFSAFDLLRDEEHGLKASVEGA